MDAEGNLDAADDVCHRLLSLQSAPPYETSVVVFASDYIRECVVEALHARKRDELLVFLRAAAVDATCGGIRGELWEAYVHRRLRLGGDFDVVMLKAHARAATVPGADDEVDEEAADDGAVPPRSTPADAATRSRLLSAEAVGAFAGLRSQSVVPPLVGGTRELRHKPVAQSRPPSVQAPSSLPCLRWTLPACTLRSFSSLSDFIADPLRPLQYAKPWTRSLEAVDSFTTAPSRLFQITVSRRHDLKSRGIRELMEGVHALRQSQEVAVVFVVPPDVFARFTMRTFTGGVPHIEWAENGGEGSAIAASLSSNPQAVDVSKKSRRRVHITFVQYALKMPIE